MIYYITYITYFIPIEIIDIIAIIDIISLPCHTPCRTVPWNPLAFKTYRGTIPMPTSWQTTSCIRPRNPPGGRQAHLESDCVGGAEWFRCHRQEPPAVFKGYFRWGWCRELDSCSQARIGPRTNWFQPCWNVLIAIISIIHIIDISDLIDIITIFRIVECFQRRYECTFERLGSSVSRSRCWEQQ